MDRRSIRLDFCDLIWSLNPRHYLESAEGRSLTALEYRSHLNAVLREFLLSGGKGEKIPKVEKAETATEGPEETYDESAALPLAARPKPAYDPKS